MTRKILDRVLAVRPFAFALAAFAFSITSALAAITVNTGNLTLEDAYVGETYDGYLYWGFEDEDNVFDNVSDDYTIQVKDGTDKVLPPGLKLNKWSTLDNSAEIWGPPSAIGTYQVELTVTDGEDSVDFTVTLSVRNAPFEAVSGKNTLPAAFTGVETSIPLSGTVKGGVGTYSFALTEGSLPDGLSLINGVITGVPTTVGTSYFTITVSDPEKSSLDPSDLEYIAPLPVPYALEVKALSTTEYLDANGTSQTAKCIVLDTDTTTLNAGWYVVDGTLSYKRNTSITVSGEVNLILASGSSLTVENGARYNAGIVVASGSTLNIFGQPSGSGSLTVTGGTGGAGIGGGNGASGGTVGIYGGTIKATGGLSAAGIGGGKNAASQGTLIVGGMTVKAGSAANPTTVLTPSAGGSIALGGERYYVVEPTASEYTITYMSGSETLTLSPAKYVPGEGVESLPDPETQPIGCIFSAWYDNAALSGDPVTSILATATGDKTFYAKWVPYFQDFTYVDCAGDPQTVRCTALTESTTTLTAGWYFVPGTMTINGTVTVSGDVKLVLKDDATLTVSSIGSMNAIVATGDGNSLTVYGQSIGGTGKLSAVAVAGGARPAIDGNIFVPAWLGVKGGASENPTTKCRRDIETGAVNIGTYTYIDIAAATPSAITYKYVEDGVEKTIDGLSPAGYYEGKGATLPTAGKVDVFGYEFQGWYKTSDLLVSVSEITASDTGDKTFWAKLAVSTTGPIFTIESGVLKSVDLNGNTEVEIPNTATEIGAYAFSGCTTMTKVTMLPNITKIGEMAFYGCTSLAEINPTEACAANIPDNVTSIGESAFYGCKGLTGVTLRNGSIGKNAFSGCSNLATLNLVTGVETIGEMAFFGCTGLTTLRIPGSVESIGKEAFRGCTNLATLSLVSGVKAIGDGAFKGCTSLTSAEALGLFFPDSVESIGAEAFYGCSALTKVSLPNSQYDVTGAVHPAFIYVDTEVNYRRDDSNQTFFYIDNVTFDGLLVRVDIGADGNVTIPGNVTEIQSGLFARNPKNYLLKSVTIPGTVKIVGTRAFAECTSLATLVLQSGIKTINGGAFTGCNALTSVAVPAGVEIESMAFSHCLGLRSLTVGGEEQIVRRRTLTKADASGDGGESAEDGSTKIGGFTFYGCSALEDAELGKTVSEIGGGAFAGCPSLTRFSIAADNPNFTVTDGMLLTADGKSLISAYGEKTSITIPEGVTGIADGAFADYGTLTSVVLTYGVLSVGEAAFSNCTALASATIANSVARIGANAFCGTALATVNVLQSSYVPTARSLIAGSGYDASGVAFGDAGSGYVVTPTVTEETVEVEIPSGVAADKITVEVPPTAKVKPNGANVKVVNGGNDITAYLDLPAADGDGAIDIAAATVKEEIVKETLDPAKEGVALDLSPSDPSITTAATRPGLTYTFSEGTTLEGMTQTATKAGDGKSWTPAISVKGGNSGFYSIGVTK